MPQLYQAARDAPRSSWQIAVTRKSGTGAATLRPTEWEGDSTRTARENSVRRAPARTRAISFGAAQESLAGVSDDLADGVEQEKAQPFGSGDVQFHG
jgi:hypothetical protein